MTHENVLSDLGPLYHSYRWFGVDNEQIPGMYEKNQRAKEAIIGSYILHSLAKCSQGQNPTSFCELFCADGYYAMLARHFGATNSVGIDNDRDGHFEKGHAIADRLGLKGCEFRKADVNDIGNQGQFDIVANVGGLYHVTNPEDILDLSYAMARQFLIVQTVVSLATNDKHYFETPAPGWDWGSRYSAASFARMISRKGWNIVDAHFNHLEGNDRPEDRGSVYFLISKVPPAGFNRFTPFLRGLKARLP